LTGPILVLYWVHCCKRLGRLSKYIICIWIYLWMSQIPIYGIVYVITFFDKELYLDNNRILLIWYGNDYGPFYSHFIIPYWLFYLHMGLSMGLKSPINGVIAMMLYFTIEFNWTKNGTCFFTYGVGYGTFKYQFMEFYIW